MKIAEMVMLKPPKRSKQSKLGKNMGLDNRNVIAYMSMFNCVMHDVGSKTLFYYFLLISDEKTQVFYKAKFWLCLCNLQLLKNLYIASVQRWTILDA
jgi:hypothetical protein